MIDQIATELAGYSLLQIDLETGRRGARTLRIEQLLHELTGAEAALVVNNNAAATMLVLAAVAGGREVIVSRGQLIEIGGSYRLPDVMETSALNCAKLAPPTRRAPTTTKRQLASRRPR